MIILIDNGHGIDTAGKCSPDGQHREYLWTRMFASRLVGALCAKGFDARRIVSEDSDVSIRARVARVNNICAAEGREHVVLLSIHNDAAAADGQWHAARGFSARVAMNASDKSRRLATLIAQAMAAEGITVRKPLPTQWYWQQNLGICRDTRCPAVLCENLFQDNREDVRLLHDETFLRRLTRAYLAAIEKSGFLMFETLTTKP